MEQFPPFFFCFICGKFKGTRGEVLAHQFHEHYDYFKHQHYDSSKLIRKVMEEENGI